MNLSVNQHKPHKSGVEIVAQGSLLTVTPFRQLTLFPKSNGSRGSIESFSHKSRKRLLETIARLKSPGTPGFRSSTSFLTLTTAKILHPIDFKPMLFTWLKRLARKSPRLSAVWRIEYQQRGATHAHLIMYKAPFLDKKWIQTSWGEVVGEERPFTRVERVRSHKGVMAYASKYIAKCDDPGFNNVPYLTADKETGEIRPIGRQWGIYNRLCLPFAETTEATVPLDGSFWLLKSYCQKLWLGLTLDTTDGWTIFCDNPESHLEYLVSLSKQFIASADSA